MRKEVMDILACPVCKGPLTLAATEERGDDVVTGSLRCDECDESYPIRESVPNLLPPGLRSP